MQVAINRLIKEQRPERLIIETSGIGHPRGILRSLRGENYQGVLQLRASITLVDPEKLLDPRYLEHELFNEQLAVGDVLVANKVDLASLAAMQRYVELAASFQPPKRVVAETVHGRLDPAWLDLHALPRRVVSYVAAGLDETAVAYDSHGWYPGDGQCFSRAAVERWMAGLSAVRVKGVLVTDEGPLLFNAESGRVTVSRLNTLDRAAVEVLGIGLDADGLEAGLGHCLVPSYQ
jgi:G3E family GTPase